MSMRQAELSDLDSVKYIAETTISEIYPHYYPKGAVEFFLKHHNEVNITDDIRKNRVFLCLDQKQNIVGTITIKENEIYRLFVLPAYQGNGYGAEMLNYAEYLISRQYSEVELDASLPAKIIYHKRGYRTVDCQVIAAGQDDFLCYDVMRKQV